MKKKLLIIKEALCYFCGERNWNFTTGKLNENDLAYTRERVCVCVDSTCAQHNDENWPFYKKEKLFAPLKRGTLRTRSFCRCTTGTSRWSCVASGLGMPFNSQYLTRIFVLIFIFTRAWRINIRLERNILFRFILIILRNVTSYHTISKLWTHFRMDCHCPSSLSRLFWSSLSLSFQAKQHCDIFSRL